MSHIKKNRAAESYQTIAVVVRYQGRHGVLPLRILLPQTLWMAISSVSIHIPRSPFFTNTSIIKNEKISIDLFGDQVSHRGTLARAGSSG